MIDFNFDELVQSMKEAIAIEKGTQKPSRKFAYTPLMLKQYEKKLTNPKLSFPIC